VGVDDLKMRHRVVATAGHVDHGKSTLVEALTGVNPDRLMEEQRREMTIDLGFASMSLPDGTTVGIVDVPGHRDFIHNMLAGVGGVDAVILVVAADEGIMPQTQEHLEILTLLEVRQGVVAITKADLVDEDWLELVVDDVRSQIDRTSLAKAPVVVVSAVSGKGLDQLVVALGGVLAEAPTPEDVGQARLPIDRVFTLRGQGTIVTGTLTGGSLRNGQQVRIWPGGLTARIRSLQSHGKPLEKAEPGSRVAANLVGVEKEQVARGYVLADGDWIRPTAMFDARMWLLESAPAPLAHAQEVHLFSGTFDTMARVRLLDSDALMPGDVQWVQILCSRPVPIVTDDRFIVRSPSATLGGGVVVDSHPQRRHRTFDRAVIRWLERMSTSSVEERLIGWLECHGPTSLGRIRRKLDLSLRRAAELARSLETAGRLMFVSGRGDSDSDVVADVRSWESLATTAVGSVAAYHREHHLSLGMAKEDLRRLLGMHSEAFTASIDCWVNEGRLRIHGNRIALPDWEITLADEERQRAEELLSALRKVATAGLTMGEAEELVGGAELVRALVFTGEIVLLGDSIVVSREVYEWARQVLTRELERRNRLSVAEARNLLKSNRRVTLALLNRLDDEGFTRRMGDFRVPGHRFSSTVEA